MTLKGSVVLPRKVTWLTRADTPRDQWLAARRQGIGGSEVSVILGSNPWKTGYGLWLEKTGRATPAPPLERANWGTLLEDTVAREWSRRNGGATIRRAGMCADTEYPWRLASVDRVWVKKGTRQPIALLEVKTTSARAAGLSNSELVERYYHQVQWYMGVTGVDMCELAILIGGQELRHLSVDFDYATYPETAWTVDDWWQKHILGDTPPPVVAADNSRLNLTPAEPVEAVIADTGMEHELDRLRELRHRIKTDSDEAAWIEAQIKATLGHATELCDPAGTILATWREQTATRFDSKKLKTEQPELWQQYATTTSSRVLRLPKGDEA